MRRIRSVVVPIALGAVFLFAPTMSQAGESYGRKLSDKASRGLANVTLGWNEVPKNVINISSDQGYLCGLTWGVLRGVAHSVGRTVIGAAQFITSPIPTDKEYITPPYIWDRASEDTRYWGIHIPGPWHKFGPLDDGGFDQR